jgi:hypothetical protein
MTSWDHLSDDELVSAYVDGELDAAGQARVEGDADLLAAADRLRGVRALVAGPTPAPDPQHRREAIAAAMAAFDTALVPVAARRVRRRRASTRWFASPRLVPVLGGAVAAGLLVVVGVTLGLRGTPPADDGQTAFVTTTEETERSHAEAGGAGEDSTIAIQMAPEDGAADATASAVADLGALDTIEALRDAVSAAASPSSGSDGLRTEATEPLLCAPPDGTSVFATYTATWQATPAVVFTAADSDAPTATRLVVVDRATCSVLIVVPVA